MTHYQQRPNGTVVKRHGSVTFLIALVVIALGIAAWKALLTIVLLVAVFLFVRWAIKNANAAANDSSRGG